MFFLAEVCERSLRSRRGHVFETLYFEHLPNVLKLGQPHLKVPRKLYRDIQYNITVKKTESRTRYLCVNNVTLK